MDPLTLKAAGGGFLLLLGVVAFFLRKVDSSIEANTLKVAEMAGTIISHAGKLEGHAETLGELKARMGALEKENSEQRAELAAADRRFLHLEQLMQQWSTQRKGAG